jgi:SAM-dependent methyltransferase
MESNPTGSVIRAKLQQYLFFQVIELDEGLFTPGFQEVVPLQQYILKALASLPFQGKRVLDIGCRDGLFCFEEEKRGAREVIGIDNNLSTAAVEFLIPYFHSQVKMFEVNIYDLTPEMFGMFDVIIFPGVLYHLRYPFWALRLIRDVLVDGGQVLIETALLDAWDSQALLYCPIGAESPYEPTSVTFQYSRLIDTLHSLGITVRTIEYLGARATKRLTLELKPEPDIELAMPINRATLMCEKTLRRLILTDEVLGADPCLSYHRFL